MRYTVTFLLTIIIFSTGIFLGNYLSEKKLDSLSEVENRVRMDTLSAEVQYQILIGNPCQFVNSSTLAEDLYELAEKLDFLEGIFGEDDEDVLRLKEQYSLIEIRHWLYIRQTNEECGTNNKPILYFYSNEGDCPDCEEQGMVLSYLRKKYPDIRVYSFDMNIDNSAIQTVQEIYNVQSAPTIIIGYQVFPQAMSRYDMELALGKI